MRIQQVSMTPWPHVNISSTLRHTALIATKPILFCGIVESATGWLRGFQVFSIWWEHYGPHLLSSDIWTEISLGIKNDHRTEHDIMRDRWKFWNQGWSERGLRMLESPASPRNHSQESSRWVYVCMISQMAILMEVFGTCHVGSVSSILRQNFNMNTRFRITQAFIVSTSKLTSE